MENHRFRLLGSGSFAFIVAWALGCGPCAAAAVKPVSTPAVTSPSYPGVTCQAVAVPMRDGTLLNTFVYLPAGGGRHPVIMQRNPYGRGSTEHCFDGAVDFIDAELPVLAQHGYVTLSQDVRGTYLSQGVFNIMQQEAQDGYDAIEWAARQSWSTGKVGTTSGSYLGLTQWQPAIHTPPHLAAIAPQITASDYHDNWTYVNGVLDLWFAQSWLAGSFVPDQIARAGQEAGLSQAQIAQEVASWNADANANLATKWVGQLPLTSFPEFDVYAPYYYTWLHNPYYDAYWARLDVEPRYADVPVPALINTASYDIFSVGSVRNYHGMRAAAGTYEARIGTKLVVGAYGHPGDSGTPTFGSDGGEGLLLSTDVLLPFFDRYLKGIQNGWESTPNARIYVLLPPNSGETGTGFWVSGGDFPLPGTRFEREYLVSGGKANTYSGDGQLIPSTSGSGAEPNVVSALAKSAPDHFIYNPANPVPTTGGNMCCNAILVQEGARDQQRVEVRKDVLVYTGAPLRTDEAVIGTVNATFWAASSAVDTDFTVKLVDVHPDGLTHNVLNRIVRARLRNGSKAAPSLIVPGRPYQFTLELGNTATIFRTGHRIRVDVTSSDFPHFDRNLNTGLSNEDSSRIVIARQTVLHDAQHPSYVTLPVAPFSAQALQSLEKMTTKIPAQAPQYLEKM